MVLLENIVKQELSKAFLLCEIKIDIDDLKKRGFATQIGQMYANNLKAFQPVNVTGKIGVTSDEYNNIVNKLGIKSTTNEGYDASYFAIKLKNGDVIEVFRNTNPAYAYVFVNGNEIEFITDPNILFKKNMPEIVKQVYANHVLSKSGAENK